MNRTITILIAAASLAIAAAYGTSIARSTPNRAGAASLAAVQSKLGRILVDSKGRTLYLFEKDAKRRSACYGQCASFWPPLLTHGMPVARAGVKQSLLGTTRRANGSQQVTYAGHPLYRFLEDTRAGQTNGEGLEDFGGGWDVLSPTGKKIEGDDG